MSTKNISRSAQRPESVSTPARPRRLQVQLHYTLEEGGPCSDGLANPLFDLLAAVDEGGSIKQAAARLQVSYRHAWGLLRHWEEVLGDPVVLWSQGQPARLTPLAQQLLREERRASRRLLPHIERFRADLEAALARSSPEQRLTLRASSDLALPALQQHLASVGTHFDISFEGSTESLKALNAGQCLLAGFHVPPHAAGAATFAHSLQPWLAPDIHRLIPCMRRVQGLMLRQEHAGLVQNLEDVVRLGLRFVSRQAGSGTRLLQEHLARQQGLAQDSLGAILPTERTHGAVALCVVSGVADAGLGVKAAALQLGLHFVPLIEEEYFLACETASLAHPGIAALRGALAGEHWRRIVTALPGYLPARDPGSVQPVEQLFTTA